MKKPSFLLRYERFIRNLPGWVKPLLGVIIALADLADWTKNIFAGQTAANTCQ